MMEADRKKMAEEMMRCDDILWSEFRNAEKNNNEGRNEHNAYMWLKYDLESLLADPNINPVDVETRLMELLEQTYFKYDIIKSICLEAIKKSAAVRKDWKTALAGVQNGCDLSAIVGFCFTKNDIQTLAKLHETGKSRKKIEDLLEDCNFHSVCEDFQQGRYDQHREAKIA